MLCRAATSCRVLTVTKRNGWNAQGARLSFPGIKLYANLPQHACVIKTTKRTVRTARTVVSNNLDFNPQLVWYPTVVCNNKDYNP